MNFFICIAYFIDRLNVCLFEIFCNLYILDI